MTPSPWDALLIPAVLAVVGFGVIADLAKFLHDKQKPWKQRFSEAGRFMVLWLVSAIPFVVIVYGVVVWAIHPVPSPGVGGQDAATAPSASAQPPHLAGRGCGIYDIVPEYPDCAQQSLALNGTCTPPAEALRGGSGDLRVDLLGYCAALHLHSVRDR